jgi:hypothetical protein
MGHFRVAEDSIYENERIKWLSDNIQGLWAIDKIDLPRKFGGPDERVFYKVFFERKSDAAMYRLAWL